MLPSCQRIGEPKNPEKPRCGFGLQLVILGEVENSFGVVQTSSFIGEHSVTDEQKASANKTRDWIIRIAVFGVLGVVLVLALLDYRAKQQATATSTAWSELLKEANEENNGILQVKTLEENMQGTPVRTEKENGPQDTDLIYRWDGTFRDYVVTVKATSPSDAANVNTIEGPGEDTGE